MANTTEDKLRAALASKEGIRQAIESRGVECGADVPLSAYSEKIRQIPKSYQPGLKLTGSAVSIVTGAAVVKSN